MPGITDLPSLCIPTEDRGNEGGTRVALVPTVLIPRSHGPHPSFPRSSVGTHKTGDGRKAREQGRIARLCVNERRFYHEKE